MPTSHLPTAHHSPLRKLFLQSLQGIQGEPLVQAALQDHPAREAHQDGHLFVVAVGKAAASMAAGALAALPGVPGLGITKDAHGSGPPGWEWREASHPVPDLRSQSAAHRLLEKADSMGPEDRMLLLLSGGASALLAAPLPGLTLDDLAALTHALLQVGATIQDLNVVRRRLSQIKGGGLLRALSPAKGWTLAISDVPGDEPAVIGSGIAVAARPSAQEALGILTAYALRQGHPKATRLLEAALETDAIPAAAFATDAQSHMPFAILASNDIWQEQVAKLATTMGIADEIVRLSPAMDQPMHKVLSRLEALFNAPPTTGSRLTLLGGEPTLAVAGKGMGGRMQHLAALCAKKLHKRENIQLLAAASDGTDGPTDATGALVDGKTWALAQVGGCDGDKAIERNDSYAFHKAAGSAIVTGATGTNVCDLVMVWQP